MLSPLHLVALLGLMDEVEASHCPDCAELRQVLIKHYHRHYSREMHELDRERVLEDFRSHRNAYPRQRRIADEAAEVVPA